MDQSTFDLLVWGWIIVAIVLVPVQLKITAPYGRHVKAGWGPMIDNRLGWIIMEIISPIVFAFFFLQGKDHSSVSYLFFGIWMLHYFNRSVIFPLRTKTTGKKIPLTIVFSAIFFNVINGGINGYYFGHIGKYTTDWFLQINFWVGAVVFVTGVIINLQSDHILISLRKGNEKGYKIPYGGLFKYISCPNHFGEMVEWVGFAIMAWSLPAFSFALWTIANLLPRAMSHHRWYKAYFEDYPKSRRAAIPFLV